MQLLTPKQVELLNALTSPKDSREKLWADRKNGSRGQVVKVTRTRVYFEDSHDCTIWSEHIRGFKGFQVLKLTNPLKK